MAIAVSIPDRVLGIFRLGTSTGLQYANIVSIPDRVLGIFRHTVGREGVAVGKVSIPDRVLGIFRLLVVRFRTHRDYKFQSLIGF